MSFNTLKHLIPVAWIKCCLLIGVAAFGLCGCSQDAPVSKSKMSKYGGTLHVGTETGFYGFDIFGPGKGGELNPSMATLNNLIQEPLFRLDLSGNIIPVLGLSAILSDNNRAWDIKLRQSVFFHDGTPFNADAVVLHWQRQLDPDNHFTGRKIFQAIQAVEKVDDYTVRFVLEFPWPPFLKLLSDESYLSVFIPSPRAVKEGTHNGAPVGTGPFKFFKDSPTDGFIVVKNHDYWQKGLPYLDKIIFRVLPDHQSRYASLIAGQMDVIYLDRGNLIQKADKAPSFFTHHAKGSGAEIVLINMRKPPLDDIRVRRALAFANYQKQEIKLAYGGILPFARHPLGEAFECVNDAYPEHDLEKARQLIADYGKPVIIGYLHSNTSRGKVIGELFQQLCKSIGVDLKLIPLPANGQIMRVLKRDFHLATWRILSVNDHGPQLYRSFHSKSPTNFTGYSSTLMDALLQSQRTEMGPEIRKEILCDIARLINKDVPILYRGGRRRYIAASEKVKNISDIAGLTVNMATAWIDSEKKSRIKTHKTVQKVVDSFDCPDPCKDFEDTDVIKAKILGTWKGMDDWGAKYKFIFKEDNTVRLHKTGRMKKTVPYEICSSKVYFQGRVKLVATPGTDKNKMEIQWKRDDIQGVVVFFKGD
ncbi:MAG: hypothetical protein GY729_04610 [Desulfobacteraceae bacterium]|nr:hypothetical protein [Desulfobacteraceae bacterium]